MQGLIFSCALSWRGEKNLPSMLHSWSFLDHWVLTEATDFWMNQQAEYPNWLSVTHLEKKIKKIEKPKHKQKFPQTQSIF